jgi:hypothetical protein
LLLDVSELGLNAELVVASLLLPESLELLTLSLGEGEGTGLDSKSSLAQLVQLRLEQSVGRESEVTLELISTRVGDLKAREVSTHSGLDFLPVDLEVLIISSGGLEVNDDGVLKVLVGKNYVSSLIECGKGISGLFLLLILFLVSCLGISLL